MDDSTSADIRRGADEVKDVLEHVLTTKEYWIIGVSNASVNLLGKEYWIDFNARVEAHGVREHLLLNADFENTVDLKAGPLREFRVLPPQMTQMTEIVVFGDEVALVVYTEEPYVFLLKDTILADMFRRQFASLWTFASDVDL